MIKIIVNRDRDGGLCDRCMERLPKVKSTCTYFFRMFPFLGTSLITMQSYSGAGDKIIPRDVLQFSDTEPRFMAALYSPRRDVRASIH